MAVPVADRAGSPATRAPAPSPRRRLVLLLVAVGLVLVVVVAAALAYRSLRAARAAAPGRPRHSPLAMPLPPPKVERVPGTPFGPDGTRLVVPAGQTAEEVFITGGARYFRPAGRWTRDGRWRVRTSTATAIYTTRLVIVRPAEDAAFNGAVVLDWIGTDTRSAALVAAGARRNALVASGFAWVGVTAEPAELKRLKEADPARYGRLGHAGSSYAYDIYSQAAKALREPDGLRPLGALEVRQLVGEADPEATPRLVTYVNAVQQHARLFDGFLLRRRPRLGAPLAVSPQPLIAVPDPTPLRRAEGAPLHVCLGGGAVAAEPRRIAQPPLEPQTGLEIARARALMAEMGCPSTDDVR